MIIIILKSNPDAFSFPDAYRLTKISYNETQYLGLVTISTLGYGDIIPLAPIARSATTLMTVLGQPYRYYKCSISRKIFKYEEMSIR
jgi:hypothetical protein